MEEKQEKKQEPEFKGKMGTVWLVGILVIILGCVTVYTFKLVNENKKLKQLPPEPQTVAKVEETKEEPAKGESTASEEKKDETKSTTTEKTTYTFNDLEGVYEYSEKTKIAGEKATYYYKLTLFKDGTYEYVESDTVVGVPFGTIGNYTIDSEKVVLNSWFETGSDVSLTLKSEQKSYSINKEGTIGKMKKNSSKITKNSVKNALKSAIKDKAFFMGE